MDMVNDAPAMFPVSGPFAGYAKVFERAQADAEINRRFIRAEKRAVDRRGPYALFAVCRIFGGHAAIAFPVSAAPVMVRRTPKIVGGLWRRALEFRNARLFKFEVRLFDFSGVIVAARIVYSPVE
jgi:hypothetical protein